MRLPRLALALVATLSLPCASVAQSPSGDEAARIKAVVDNFVQPFLANNHAPGALVGVSTHGRRYYFSYGQANDEGMPFTSSTLVEIGSCTKVFTTTLFSLAVNRNQIAPNAPIPQYMPPGHRLQPAAQQVTPLQLADFTSGMPDDPPNLPNNLQMRGIDHYTTNDFLKWVSRWSPQTPLPAPYLYSNAGIGLLTYLIADATGTPWEKQLNTEITGPLGMVDTEMRPGPQQSARMAEGHLADGAPAPAWPIYAWYGAGALRSTAQDMLSFGEANLGHAQVAGRPVSPALTQAMQAAQQPIYTLPNGVAQQAMAWWINNGDAPGLRPEIVKDGGTDGFSTAILLNHSKDITIFVEVNQRNADPTRLAVVIGRHLP